jgi:upstream activation factor subunit UAF30
MAEPSELELKNMIREMVVNIDLERTGVKKFTKLLSKKFGGIDFSHRKKFIKTTLTDIINEDGSDDREEDGEKEEEEEKVETKPRRKSSGGLTAVKEISDELAAFLGQGKEMARTEIVKSLWTYIRDHGLQNPDNKREIFLDKRMKAVFGCDTFSMVRITVEVNPV